MQERTIHDVGWLGLRKVQEPAVYVIGGADECFVNLPSFNGVPI